MSHDSSPLPEDDPRPAPPARYRIIQRVEGPIAHALGLSCREFARLTVTRLDRPLSSSEQLRHRLHGAMCGLCAKFSAQFAELNALTREIESETPASGTAPSDSSTVDRINAAVRAQITKR